MKKIYTACGILAICLFSICQSFAQTPQYFTTGGTSSNSFPFNSTASNKVQWLYKPADFSAVPISGNISKVYIKSSNAQTSTYTNISIKIGYTTLTTFPAGTSNFETGLTEVYFTASRTIASATDTWIEFSPVTGTFFYDGAQNIVVEASETSYTGTGFSVRQNTAGGNLRLFGGVASATGTGGTGQANFGFDLVPAGPCVSPPSPGNAAANPDTTCSGSPVVLSVSGHSDGTGQTYQWQSGLTSAGPWTNIGASSNIFVLTVNPTDTTWYRVAITCSGNTDYSSPAEVVVNPAFPGGTYTIDGGAPTGGTNFQTFTEAINAIACGISGPIVFNVTPGSYTEQVTIPQVNGSSATNTITFKGNLATISFNSANTSARAGIHLNGADHIIIDSLIIDGAAGTYAWGIMLTNQADSNRISNCTIISSTTNTTATNFIGIGINGSATATASSGNNGNGNLILNNTITGGYYGIYLYGNSASTAQNMNNEVRGNIIQDAYVYAIYSAYQSAGLVVSKNEISKPTRNLGTSTTTTYGIFITTGTQGALVEKNRLHNMYDVMQSNTGAFYALYVAADATAGAPNIVSNNLVYNIGGNGTLYALYNTGGDHMHAYHNTLAIDDQSAVAGAAYGIYQTTAATGLEYRNNIVVVNRSGTGIKRAIYFVTTTSTIISNNNVLVMMSTGGTNNHLGQFGTTNYTTLADWKTANSAAYDQQSESIDPMFTNPGAVPADYTPMEPTINNIGVSVGITTDINDSTRSNTSPDPGAFEFSLLTAGINMGAEALITPATHPRGCYSSAETITIRIRNSRMTTHDFATNPVTVTVNISGAVTQTLNHTINTGTLDSDSVMYVVMPGTVNMSSTGTYSIDASTSVAGDVNPGNNSMPTATRTKEDLIAGTVAGTPESHCVSASANPTLSASGTMGYGGLQWQQSTTAGSGFTDIPGGTTSPFIIPGTITQTMYYRLNATCGGTSVLSNEIEIQFNNPQLTSTTPATRCGTGSVSLLATGSAGTTVNWYTAASGGSPVHSGDTFNTPVINTTTTYYAGASASGTGSIDSVAVPLSQGNTTGVYHHMFLVNSPTGMTFTGLGLKVSNTAGTMTAWDIYYRPDNYQTIPGANTSSAGWTLLSSVSNVPSLGTTTYTTILSGVSVDIPAGATYSFYIAPVGAATHQYGTATAGTTVGSNANASIIAGHRGSALFSVTTSGGNPVAKIFYSMGCNSSRTAVTATITPPPTLTVTAGKTICNSAVHLMEVTSNISEFNTYIWSPTTGLYTDAAAITPYTGTSATQVYVKNPTAGTTTYTLTATNTTSQCTNTATSTVIVMPDPVIASSVPEICISGSATLSLSPATGYGAASFQWQVSPDGTSYTDSSGATNDTLVTPVLTQTRYYKLIMKDQAGATCSTSPVKQMTVNNPQVTGTTPASRCGPGSVTLGATGSAGATLEWYAASSGGTSIGSGNSFNTPGINSTTTYYVSAQQGGGGLQYVGAPNLSIGASAVVGTYYVVFTVSAPLTIQSVEAYFNTMGAPFTINIRNAPGGSSVFTYNGTVTTTGTSTPQVIPINATLNPGNYEIGWTTDPGTYRNSTGGAYPYTIPGVISITGNTFNNAAYYYYFYHWAIATGCESARTAVTATVNPTASNAAGASGTTECATVNVSGTGTVEFNHTDCDAIAQVTPGGANPVSGNVTACVTIDPSVSTVNGQPYLQRHYDITPATNAATATALVKLFFLQSEFNAYNAASGAFPKLPTGPTDVAGINNFRITQFHGTGSTPGGYSGTAVMLAPGDSLAWNASLNRWEVAFYVNGFSGFYVHTGAWVLPVTLTNFRGELKESFNRLLWTTSTEINNRGFDLERSSDGRTFSSIAFVASKAENGNSTSALNYSFDDTKPFAGNNYYRLKQIDKDGKYAYSTTVLLSRKVTAITMSSVYPNPTRGELNLLITAPSAEKVTIVITDLSGKVVMQQPAQLKTGDNQQQLNVQHLAQGSYIIKAVCANGCESAVHRFVKQ